MGENLRPSGDRPHPCRVNILESKKLGRRTGRLGKYFSHTSFVRTAIVLLLLLISARVASPQQTADTLPRPAAASTAAKSVATNFPQLPYQGTPPELPQ